MVTKEWNMNKNIIIVLIFTFTFILTACSMPGRNMYKIGIVQSADSDTLNGSTSGFIRALEDLGFVHGENCIIEVEYGQGDVSQLEKIATTFAKKKDLIVGVGTIASNTAVHAAKDTDVPVIYITTSDPFREGFVLEDGSAVGNITGISVELDKEEQISSIRELLPAAQVLGIIYNEEDSELVSSILEYEAIALEYGFRIVSTGIYEGSHIEGAVMELLEEVDCMISLDDFMINDKLPEVISLARVESIPVFSFAIEQVQHGSIGAHGIDYYEVGKEAAAIACEIISSENQPSEIPYIIIKKAQLCLNDLVIKELGITTSSELLDKVEVTFETITPIY